MNSMKQFEVGKKYKGSFGTYAIVKRTKCFVTLSNGCRYKVEQDSLNKCEAIYFKRYVNYWGASFKELEGVYSSNPVED